MTGLVNFTDQIRYIVNEKPGVTSKELEEYFPDRGGKQISARLKQIIDQGGYRREGEPYRYYRDPSAQPARNRAMLPVVEKTDSNLTARIKELEAWKADAIRRHPDLAVPAVTLKARDIVAELARELGDQKKVDSVMAGWADNSMLIRATVRALEMGGV